MYPMHFVPHSPWDMQCRNSVKWLNLLQGCRVQVCRWKQHRLLERYCFNTHVSECTGGLRTTFPLGHVGGIIYCPVIVPIWLEQNLCSLALATCYNSTLLCPQSLQMQNPLFSTYSFQQYPYFLCYSNVSHTRSTIRIHTTTCKCCSH